MPKYSIIVPFYNVRDYIIECAESIYNQKYEDFEVIFVDDGSPDDSKKILKKYIKKINDKRFKIITKENGGQGSARNLGLKKCKGKYVLFLDSDDFLDKECLYEVDKVIKKKNLDILIFDFYNYFSKNNYYVLPGMYEFDKNIQKMAIISPPAPWNKIYNKDFLINTKIFFPEKIWYEDMATSARVACNTKKIYYLKKPLHYYRQRQGSVMNSFNKKIFDMYEVLNIIYNYYVDNNLLNKYYSEVERIFVYNVFFVVGKLRNSNYKKRYNEQIKIINYLNNNFPKWYKNKYLKKERTLTRLHIKIMKHTKILKFYNMLRSIK